MISASHLRSILSHTFSHEHSQMRGLTGERSENLHGAAVPALEGDVQRGRAVRAHGVHVRAGVGSAVTLIVLAGQSAHLRILSTKRVAENASQMRFTYNQRSPSAFSATHFTDENSQHVMGLTGGDLVPWMVSPSIRASENSQHETCG